MPQRYDSYLGSVPLSISSLSHPTLQIPLIPGHVCGLRKEDIPKGVKEKIFGLMSPKVGEEVLLSDRQER